jgi:hypothetical protein
MLPLRVEHSTVAWRFWIFWMLATLAGGVLFALLSIPINWALAQIVPQWNTPPSQPGQSVFFLLTMALDNGLLGAVLGWAQWLVLKRERQGLGRWVLATAVGFALGGLLMYANLPGLEALGPAKAVLQFGLLPAIFQWLALRGHVYQAGWWILFTLLGWPLAFLLIRLAYLTGWYVEPFDLVSALLVPAAVAGAGMVWLLRRPVPRIIRF